MHLVRYSIVSDMCCLCKVACLRNLPTQCSGVREKLIVRTLYWKKCADCRDRGDSYLLSEADVMSVADYGPSSQTLTFLDPEDDLGSLGIGADTQV